MTSVDLADGVGGRSIVSQGPGLGRQRRLACLGKLDGCGCFFFLSARGKRGVAVSGCLFQDLLTVDLCDEEPRHPSFCGLPPPGCLVLRPLPPPCLQKQRPMGPVRVNFGVWLVCLFCLVRLRTRCRAYGIRSFPDLSDGFMPSEHHRASF